MAIAMARAGGLGVIHRFLPLDQQVAEVERVKRAENLVIAKPYAIAADATIAEALELMRSREVKSLLVTAPDGRLGGILTTRDLVLAAPGDTVGQHATPRERLVTASPGIDLDEARELLHRHRLEKLPLLDDDGLRGGPRHDARPDGAARAAAGLQGRARASCSSAPPSACAATGWSGPRRSWPPAPTRSCSTSPTATPTTPSARSSTCAASCPTPSWWPATSPPARAPTTSATRAPTRSRSASGRAPPARRASSRASACRS